MGLNTDEILSSELLDEIKWRIKSKYASQENFARVFGASRKTLSKLLNHNRSYEDLIRICKLLDIKGIVIR